MSVINVFSGADNVSIKIVATAALLHRGLKNLNPAKGALEQLLGGHQALRENLVQGLSRAGIPYALNSFFQIPEGRQMGLLAGKRILQELISKKSRVVVGPNYVVSPREDSETLASNLVSAVLVPSIWVADFYAHEVPQIKEKLRVWACGVDTNFWRPLEMPVYTEKGSRNLLVYSKIADPEFVSRVAKVMKAKNYAVRVLHYGSYSHREYRNELRWSDLVVWIGSSESQGLAQFEAWATGVPTLIFDSRSPLVLPGAKSAVVPHGKWSPGPYLTENRGEFWTSIDDLVWLCEQYFGGIRNFSPRSEVVEGFSLEVSAMSYAALVRG